MLITLLPGSMVALWPVNHKQYYYGLFSDVLWLTKGVDGRGKVDTRAELPEVRDRQSDFLWQR